MSVAAVAPWQSDPHWAALINQFAVSMAQYQQYLATEESVAEVVHHFAGQFRAIANGVRDGLPATQEPEQHQHIRSVAALWELVHLCFFQSEATHGRILDGLAQWSASHFEALLPQLQRLTEVVNEGLEAPQNLPQYWPLMLKFAATGQYEHVAEMVEMHTEFLSRDSVGHQLRQTQRVVLDRPAYPDLTADAASQWKTQVTHLLQSASRVREIPDGLLQLLRLFTWAPAALRTLKALKLESAQLFVALLLYRQPQATIDEFEPALEVLDQQGIDFVDGIDPCIRACLLRDASELVQAAEPLMPLKVFSVHFMHLLKVIPLEGWDSFQQDLEETTIQYAETLASVKQQAIVAAYYQTCACGDEDLNEEAQQRVADVIQQSLNTNTDTAALKAVQICRQLRLHEFACAICQNVAQLHKDEGALEAAVMWFLEGKDTISASQIADQIMFDYAKARLGVPVAELDPDDVFLHVYSDGGDLDRLQCVALLKQMLVLRDANKLTDAAKLLQMLLIDRPIIPKWFWALVLLDSVPMLEARQLAVDAEGTLTLMQCLEELEMSHRRDEFVRILTEDCANAKIKQLDSTMQAVAEGKLKKIRMALVRNLARAHLAAS
eukprot:m.361422 g.361422  ORF g.361422 m.361422 type:complete len:609 (+) comp19583_c0_seq1:191-2017(+)